MEIINQSGFQFSFISGRIGFPKHTLSLIVKGTFDLVPDKVAVLGDEQIFPTGDELYSDDDEGCGSCRYESDFAYHKPRADFLLAGKCHVPGGKPVQACKVTFQVGDRTKTLGVFGNRYWNQITRNISNPEPYIEMELRYENSFGGKGYKKNPVGKGYGKVKREDGSKVLPLPNIEDLNHLIDSPGSRPEPAGFGPIGNMWAQRFAKLGTYKGNWLKKRWPWFPDDFDWSFFNAAPLDMQIEGYFKGDEPLYFENLHPVHSQYRCQLPGLRARLFLNKLDLNDPKLTRFTEVPLNLDTLWIDMELEKLVLVWRGVMEVLSEDYEEIAHCFIIAENLEETFQTKEYYQDLFYRQIAEKEEPEKPEIEPIAEDINIEEKITEAEASIKAALIKEGIDPEQELPEHSQEDMEAEIRLIEKLEFEQRKELPPLTREIVQERIIRGEGFAGEDLRGIDLSGIDMQEVDFRNAILAEVNLQKSNFSKADFSKADFSKADLSATNLNGVIFEDTDLTETDLSGADLTDSVANDAIFDRANLTNAILENCFAEGASFYEADLTNASLKNSFCRASDFSKSKLIEANFQNASLVEASVEEADGAGVNMTGADLTGLRASEKTNFSKGIFRNVIAPYSIWEDAILDNADFTFSQMEGVNFASASLKSANLFGADLKYSRLSRANLHEAKCTTMNLFQANLEKADLTMTDFSSSNLYGVEFLDAIIDNTKFDNANLKMTKLSRRY